MKIEKLKAELERARQKASQWQARVRELEKQIMECENTEIVMAVRSITTSPEDLRGLLEMLRSAKEPPQAAHIKDKQEVSEQHESEST